MIKIRSNISEIKVIVIRDLTDNRDFELEKDVEITFDDFLVDVKDLNITVIGGV